MKEKTIKIATAYGNFAKNDECYTPMYAILFFDKRIEYKTINKPKIYRIPFGSFYCCKDFLPTKMEFRELKRNKDEETFTKEELIKLGYQ